MTVFTALKAHEALKKPSTAARKQKPSVKNKKQLYGPARKKVMPPKRLRQRAPGQVSVARPPQHKEVACSTVVSVLGLAMVDSTPTFPGRI